METQRASLCLGRWSLWLLLLALVVPSASAQALSYREAVLRAVDRLNEQSSEANLYRLLELDQPPKADEDPGTPKPVSFTVKETVCPRPTWRPPELCDFKENGRVKQCVGTVTLDQIKDPLDITCNEIQSVGLLSRLRDFLSDRGRRLGEKIERIGQKIKDLSEFFQS
uniref:Antibacterial peptide PMAP-37 n=1 Tax=Sus scrofa TaxID=9823 RepID=PMP37_PIG|nr:RecName: Full=Antibacterial peptide PMAP-37; AltName: Full=Myeloid antibacterial peptide 37; Flags: Precursor [Sus scrofa]AAA63447.1 antibacterial peptide precursor [Sus scrofa]prf//2110242A antibacterial peptide PMAP-37 [Sus scrofa domesticus]